jgi:hypothetical protein
MQKKLKAAHMFLGRFLHTQQQQMPQHSTAAMRKKQKLRSPLLHARCSCVKATLQKKHKNTCTLKQYVL